MSLETQTKLAIYRHFAETGERPSLEFVLPHRKPLTMQAAHSVVQALACGERLTN
jgi:hypothetical protein